MFKKLRTLIYSESLTQEDLGGILNVSPTYVSRRMTGKSPFTLEDVYAICDYFDIPYGEISEYFPKPTKKRKKAA